MLIHVQKSCQSDARLGAAHSPSALTGLLTASEKATVMTATAAGDEERMPKITDDENGSRQNISKPCQKSESCEDGTRCDLKNR